MIRIDLLKSLAAVESKTQQAAMKRFNAISKDAGANISDVAVNVSYWINGGAMDFIYMKPRVAKKKN